MRISNILLALTVSLGLAAGSAPAFAGSGKPQAHRPAPHHKVSAKKAHKKLHKKRRPVQIPGGQKPFFGEAGLSGSSSLVEEARRYLGTNPTGRSSLWCAAFMDLVLQRTGHPGGGNLASAYAHYGTRISGPEVGAIAVMGRKGGGHVGVVSGFDSAGNPIIISGNHNHRVAEAVYPRGRIYAYVRPRSG